MASLRKGLWLIALIGGLIALLAAPGAVVAGVDLPRLEHGKGDRCVDDEDTIRRKHPDFLKHHRDETMRNGIRTTKYSLKQCVACHASEKTGSVAASKEDFCVACHSYVAVHLDCWDCHATRPMKPQVAAQPAPSASPAPIETGVKP